MGSCLCLTKITQDKLEGFFKRYETYLRETDRGSSARSYLGDIRRFTGWVSGRYGSFNLQGVSPIQYRHYLQGDGKAPNTVNRAIVSL